MKMHHAILLALGLTFSGSALQAAEEATEAATAVAEDTAVDEIKPDLVNGERLHRTCALCHGRWSQGIQGGRYPRLAGRSFASLQKELRDYREGVRVSQSMTVVGQVKRLTDQDMTDLNAYIASIDLNQTYPLDIPLYNKGDVKRGEALYQDDCKTCHGRKAEGKDSKDSPRLEGQRTEYMLRQIDSFKKRNRYHDNDEEDETFNDYSEQDIHDIMAYISTLDDKK